MNVIGVDIGGSHISAAQVKWKSGQAEFGTLFESDVDTFQSSDQIIAQWTSLISKAMSGLSDCRIGIAMPGPFDYPNGISLVQDQGKMKSLYGLSVKNLLAESLHLSPKSISFTNDAEAFLTGESLAGAGRGFENSMGLTLGTGLGSAIKVQDVIKDGKLWTAPFREGIAEDYLGTAWFKAYTYQKFGLKITGVKDLLSADLDPQISNQVFAQFGRTLGEFLSIYVIRLSCEGVVLGGKISGAASRFLPYTQALFDRLDYPLLIKISELGEKASLIGACLPFISAQDPSKS